MANKTLAIFGIGTYILSVLSSAENLEGNSVAPIALIVISGIATTVFIVLATICLWKDARNVSIILVSSAVLLFIFTVIQMLTSSPYGSPVIILLNTTKVIYFIVFIWSIIKLFKIRKVNDLAK